jgi:hypothetical protein
VAQMIKEVGISSSVLDRVFIWECEDCHRRWTGEHRLDCPFCRDLERHVRWDDWSVWDR